jgi:hypothetical protein
MNDEIFDDEKRNFIDDAQFHANTGMSILKNLISK